MTTYTYLVEIDTTDERPGAAERQGVNIARRVSHEYGERVRVWRAHTAMPVHLRGFIERGERVNFDPIIDDGNAPPGYEPGGTP